METIVDDKRYTKMSKVNSNSEIIAVIYILKELDTQKKKLCVVQS